MGVSTDAILAFGIDLGEEHEFIEKLEEYEDDFEEWLYFEDIDGPADYTYKSKQALIDAHPVDLITHCSGDYPMYFLAARGTQVTAHRGSPHAFDAWPAEPEGAVEKLRAFCERHGIEWTQPKWHLFSCWG